ncbi:MAG: acyl-CoA dehydrogenase family protein [Actinomycetota bacterium]
MEPAGILDPVIGYPPEDAEVAGLAREVADRVIRPEADIWEREAVFPRKAFTALGEAGLLALPYPERWGGSEVSQTSYLAAIEELAAAMLAVGLGVSVQVLTMFPTIAFGTDDQRDAWVPRAAAGEWVGSYCLSEPGSGSDAAAMTTRAGRDGDSWVLNGTKAWVTHGGESAYAVVFCRTGGEGATGISCLFVPTDTEGVTRAKLEHKMGMNASPTAQMVFDDVRLPADHLIGREGEGFRIAMAALDGGRLGIASGAVGLAREATTTAVAYARERVQFGRPIIEQQGLSFMLADMATAIEGARSLVRAAAARRDAGQPYSPQAAMAKLNATDTCMKVTTDAVQVLGGYGYVEEFPVERYMREAKVLQIVEGTNQIQRVVIGRALARG